MFQNIMEPAKHLILHHRHLVSLLQKIVRLFAGSLICLLGLHDYREIGRVFSTTKLIAISYDLRMSCGPSGISGLRAITSVRIALDCMLVPERTRSSGGASTWVVLFFAWAAAACNTMPRIAIAARNGRIFMGAPAGDCTS